jgi:hypothetical protein
VLGAVLLGGYVLSNAPTDPNTGASSVTLASFNALKDGMSYSEAATILGGPGTEISRSSIANITTVMYSWQAGYNGANMNAMFQNDKLISKAQLGLR